MSKIWQGIAMCDLSNVEILNRWKNCKKQTAKDYWYDFMARRAQYGRKDSQKILDEMNAIDNKQRGK